MIAVPFNRILWKEYRVHRALWLSCLAIGIAFQIFAAYFAYDVALRSRMLATAPVFFSVLYAIGCGAILFAGEREERTSEWLLTLAAPTSSVLTGKYLFAIVSTLALQSVMGLVTLLMLLAKPGGDFAFLMRSSLYPIALAFLIWSIVGSLVSRRVLVAIPASGIWFVIFAVVTSFLVNSLFQRFQYVMSQNREALVFEYQLSTTSGALLLIAVIIDLVLGWRWCHGQYLDGQLLGSFSPRSLLRPRRNDSEVAVVSRLPMTAESEFAWRRMWQRLRWQERRRESIPYFLLIAGCCAAIIDWLWKIIFLTRVEQTPLAAFTVFGVMAMPFAMGILGFRHDEAHQEPRFLWNRGISAISLWLAKHTVWLPRAFWIPLVIVLLLTGPDLFSHLQFAPPVVRELPRLAIGALWFGLLTYACGQLAAVMLSRVILAVAVGTLMCILAGLWLSVVTALRVPYWWSMGLPTAAMFVVALRQMKPWLAEDHSWGRTARLIGFFVLGPVLMFALLALHRVGEPLYFRLFTAGQIRTSQVWNLTAQQLSRPLTDLEESARVKLTELSMQRLSQKGPDDDPTKRPWKAQALEIVQLLNSDVGSLNRPFGSNEAQFQVVRFQGAGLILRQVAEETLTAGELEQSFECRLAELKLCRVYASRGGLTGWGTGSYKQKDVMEGLVNWAKQPEQTAAGLNAAFNRVSEELTKFPRISETVVFDYQESYSRFVIGSDEKYMENVRGRDRYEDDFFYSLKVAFARLPWERQRYALLLPLQAMVDFEECLLRDGPSLAGPSDQPWPAAEVANLSSSIRPMTETTFQPQGVLPQYDFSSNARTAEVSIQLKQMFDAMKEKQAQEPAVP